MGYTHYWNYKRNQGLTGEFVNDSYSEIYENIVKLIKDDSGELLADGFGEGFPQYFRQIWVNGKGDESYETFSLPENLSDLQDFNCCKTARRPYDLLVTAMLCILAEHSEIEVDSDGVADDWEAGRFLAETVLGRHVENPIEVLV